MVACGGGGGGDGGGGVATPAPPPPPPAPSAPDSGAVYVFAPDAAAAFAQQAYIKASNPDERDGFGSSVALSGDTLAVTAPFEDSNAIGIDGDQSDDSADRAGAVYVFAPDATAAFAQQAYIKASNTDAQDEFGFLVALSGDTLAVGAALEQSAATGINDDQSDNSADNAGAAYVFTRDGAGVWSQQAYVKASNTDAGDEFGHFVALSGDTLAAGAVLEDSNATGINDDQSDNSAADSGAVYVFTRNAGVWLQQAYIKASNTDANGVGSDTGGGSSGDIFGHGIALSGDTLVVGASLEDSNATGIDGDQSDNSAADSGAVYVFTRTAGVWSQQAYIKASNTGAGDLFGFSVALSGDTVVVGARSEDSNAAGIDGDQGDNSAAEAGAVYVFTRTAGVWSQQAYIKASNTDADVWFGYDVALSGDTLAVGARFEDGAATGIDGDQSDNSATDAGAVYVFTRDGAGVWSQQNYVKASNTDALDEFGHGVALSGDTLAMGARLEDSAATGVNGDQSNTTANAAVAVSALVGIPTGNASLSSLDLGSDPNAINPNSKEVIPVAVLGSVDFDATQVDFSTAAFGPDKASPVHDGHVENVNDDDFLDMVFHFNTQDTGIACGDTQVTLSGGTFGGDAFTGTDSVKTAGCNR